MWELEFQKSEDGIPEYWILTKKEGDKKINYGAFFNKTLADRILAFLTSKWLSNKRSKML